MYAWCKHFQVILDIKIKQNMPLLVAGVQNHATLPIACNIIRHSEIMHTIWTRSSDGHSQTKITHIDSVRFHAWIITITHFMVRCLCAESMAMKITTKLERKTWITAIFGYSLNWKLTFFFSYLLCEPMIYICFAVFKQYFSIKLCYDFCILKKTSLILI